MPSLSLLPFVRSFPLALLVGLGALGACSSSESTPSPATSGDGGADATAALTPEQLKVARAACELPAGATVEATLGAAAAAQAAKMPIEHVIVLMRENRAFDHYFGSLPKAGQPDVETWPATFTNKDKAGVDVAPFHADTTCFKADPPHQWDGMHKQWNEGKMDGFLTNAGATTTGDGHYAIAYFDQTDLPFYYFLANTYAIADRMFSSVLSGTFANRNYLLLGSSYGIKNTLVDGYPTGKRTIFDALDEKGVTWGVYTPTEPLEGTLGWEKDHKGVASVDAFLKALGDGTLPSVSFVDSTENVDDEHPPADVQKGEAWTRAIYEAATKSPLWAKTAIFLVWDESGGLFDHVPPPKACPPSPDQAEFNQLGIRVPLLVLSPWAKKHFVSHEQHEHTSILRFIEARWGLPALTARDANSDALLDMFDVAGAPLLTPPAAPAAGTGGCK